MRAYELMLLIRSNPDEAAISQATKWVADLIASKGGRVAATDVWGRRKLAYPIDNQSEGVYVLLKLGVAPSAIKDIEFELKLNENLLRYLFVRDMTVDLSEDQAVASDEAISEEPNAEEAEASAAEDLSVEDSEEPDTEAEDAVAEEIAA